MAVYGTVGAGAIDPFKPQPLSPAATPTPVPTAPPITPAPIAPAPVKPTLAPPTYTGPINNSINNTAQGAALVNSNQAQAASIGVKIPGSTYVPPTPSAPTSTTPTEAPKYIPPANGGYDYSSASTPEMAEQQKLYNASVDAQKVDAFARQQQDILNGVTPLSPGQQAQITGLQQEYEKMIAQQTLINTGATGLANIRGAQSGALEYDMNFQTSTIDSIAKAGAAKVTALQNEEASKIAQLTEAFKQNNIAAIKSIYDEVTTAHEKFNTALQEYADKTRAAIKTANDARLAADKTYYEEVTKPIQDISLSAAKLGASPETLAAIRGATTIDQAIQAAGTSIQTSTNPEIAQYLFYKQQAGESGIVPQSYEAWQKAQTALANSQAYGKAYSTAAGTAAGAAAGALDTGISEPPIGLGATSGGGSILSATGLSVAAFNFLTQGTPSMSRMPVAQRTQIMNETQKWLNKNGIDISTFRSQYDAYNTVLQKNIQRANQTSIMAGEVEGSADALISAIDEKDLGKFKSINIVTLLKGEQLNDPVTMKYKFQLQAMANDLSGYFAAARGATSPELQDQRDAADVISSGLNKKSVTAFKDSIKTNEGKVAGVVNRAVDSTRKQVWGLFGVGDKYIGGNSSNDTLLWQQKDNPINLPISSPVNTNNPLGI